MPDTVVPAPPPCPGLPAPARGAGTGQLHPQPPRERTSPPHRASAAARPSQRGAAMSGRIAHPGARRRPV